MSGNRLSAPHGPRAAPCKYVEGMEESAFLPGIDVSHHNGRIDWDAVAGEGVVFAYAKATEGTVMRDPRFSSNWKGMRDAGLLRGAYHFFRPAQSVERQAERFLARIGEPAPGDLPPMLDLEETSRASDEWLGIERSRRTLLALAWLDLVERALGRKPVVYTRAGFIRNTLGDPGALTGYPIWLAQYASAAPTVPAGWNTWSIWQHTDRGRVAGIAGNVDLDRFNGFRADLLALAP